MAIVTDLSVNKIWNLRQGDDNEFTISFVDDTQAPFDVSGYVFSLKISNFNNKSSPIVSLGEGSGIMNAGGSGVVTFTLTSQQSSSLVNSYYYEIDTVFPDTTNHVLFQGKAIISEYEYEGSISSGITANVSLSGTNVTALITLSGGGTISSSDLSDMIDVIAGGTYWKSDNDTTISLLRLAEDEDKRINELYDFEVVEDIIIRYSDDFRIDSMDDTIDTAVTASLMLSDGVTPYTLGDTVSVSSHLLLSVDVVGRVKLIGTEI